MYNGRHKEDRHTDDRRNTLGHKYDRYKDDKKSANSLRDLERIVGVESEFLGGFTR